MKRILLTILLVIFSLTYISQAADIKKGAGVGNVIVTSFRLRNLGLENYAIATSPVVNHTDNFIRSNNNDQPGYYLIKPRGNILTVEPDRVSFLKSMLKECIRDPCYDKNGPWRDWLAQEIRYYYNTSCDANEPPPADPAIYDWPSNMLNKDPTPNWSNQRDQYHYDCRHPDH